MNRPAQIAVVSVALLTVGSIGCARWKPKPMALNSVACMYDRAAIVYHVDASRLGLPLAVSKVEAQHVSYQESPSSPQLGNSTGTLILKYPHPQAKPEMALAEVVIDSRPSGVTRPTDAIHEVWTMDVPKNDLDRIVGRLRDTRFFYEPAKGETGVHLTASLDKVSMDKEWHQVPELNLLMQQVRSHGQLVAYNRPTVGLSSTAEPEPSKGRFAKLFGRSTAPVQATQARLATHAEPAAAQAIKYDPPPTSLPNPIYAGVGGQAPPALPYNNSPAVAPAYQTAQAVAAAQPDLPGVSVSGANAIYGGPSLPRKEADNMSPALQSAVAQKAQNAMSGGGGGMGGGGMGMGGGGGGGGF